MRLAPSPTLQLRVWRPDGQALRTSATPASADDSTTKGMASDDVELNVLGCRDDILETNCDQCVCMVQCCSISTETVRLIRTGSPGRPPRLSHSSWTLWSGQHKQSSHIHAKLYRSTDPWRKQGGTGGYGHSGDIHHADWTPSVAETKKSSVDFSSA